MDDTSLFFLIHNLSQKYLLLDYLMVFLTNYVIYLTVALIFYLLFKGKTADRKAFILIAISLPISVMIILTIHLFIKEQRPFVTYNFTPLADAKMNLSFPSRHATIMSVMAFSFIYFKSKWAYFLTILAIFVGFSRIYVGVHYPLDVLGGFWVGILAVYLGAGIVKLLKARYFS